jgi:hypothetical protein
MRRSGPPTVSISDGTVPSSPPPSQLGETRGLRPAPLCPGQLSSGPGLLACQLGRAHGMAKCHGPPVGNSSSERLWQREAGLCCLIWKPPTNFTECMKMSLEFINFYTNECKQKHRGNDKREIKRNNHVRGKKKVD